MHHKKSSSFSLMELVSKMGQAGMNMVYALGNPQDDLLNLDVTNLWILVISFQKIFDDRKGVRRYLNHLYYLRMMGPHY